jgi:hypothetical protein
MIWSFHSDCRKHFLATGCAKWKNSACPICTKQMAAERPTVQENGLHLFSVSCYTSHACSRFLIIEAYTNCSAFSMLATCMITDMLSTSTPEVSECFMCIVNYSFPVTLSCISTSSSMASKTVPPFLHSYSILGQFNKASQVQHRCAVLNWNCDITVLLNANISQWFHKTAQNRKETDILKMTYPEVYGGC